MFEAVRSFAKIKPPESISVKDSKGNMLAFNAAKTDALRDHFKANFTPKDVVPLHGFD